MCKGISIVLFLFRTMLRTFSLLWVSLKTYSLHTSPWLNNLRRWRCMTAVMSLMCPPRSHDAADVGGPRHGERSNARMRGLERVLPVRFHRHQRWLVWKSADLGQSHGYPQQSTPGLQVGCSGTFPVPGKPFVQERAQLCLLLLYWDNLCVQVAVCGWECAKMCPVYKWQYCSVWLLLHCWNIVLCMYFI